MWLDRHPLLTPRSSVFVPIQAINSSLTLPMSHHECNEWLDNVEIGILRLKLLQQAVLGHEWGQMWLDSHPLFTPRLSLFGLIQAIDSSLTLPMSHHKYDEWLDKAENGI